MSKSLFQQYEEERMMFSPGKIYQNNRGFLIISIFEILCSDGDTPLGTVKVKVLLSRNPRACRVGFQYNYPKEVIKQYYVLSE